MPSWCDNRYQRMRIYISADIEGVSGLIAWSQCGRPTGEYYDFSWARERMTADVNAAIMGARQAGATEILVKDSHGNSKNLLANQLVNGTRLVTGHGSRFDGMMVGIDSGFDAALLIGYHAMAGAHEAIMEHTISDRVHRMWINGRLMGEQGLSAITAGQYGVPIVAISSDRAGCAECQDLIPNVATAIVKDGYGRYMGDVRHPDDTLGLIEAAVADGISRRKEISPFSAEPPYEVRIEFNMTAEADMAARCPGAKRIDGYEVLRTSNDWEDLHRSIWTMITLASAGADCNR